MVGYFLMTKRRAKNRVKRHLFGKVKLSLKLKKSEIVAQTATLANMIRLGQSFVAMEMR